MNIYKRPTKGGVVLLLLSFLSDPGRSDAETGQMEAAERESLEARFWSPGVCHHELDSALPGRAFGVWGGKVWKSVRRLPAVNSVQMVFCFF